MSVGLTLAACAGRSEPPRGASSSELRLGERVLSVARLRDVSKVRHVDTTSGHVYVSTDRGLLRYPRRGVASSERMGLASGLSSEDVYRASPTPGGHIAVLHARGLDLIAGRERGELSRRDEFRAAPVGPIRDLLSRDERLVACGDAGVATWDGGTWRSIAELHGERPNCRGLVAGPGDAYWILTDDGAIRVEGEIAEEHVLGRVWEDAKVIAIAEPRPGDIWVALETSGRRFELAHYADETWTRLRLGFSDETFVGLVAQSGAVVLVGPRRAYRLRADSAADVGGDDPGSAEETDILRVAASRSLPPLYRRLTESPRRDGRGRSASAPSAALTGHPNPPEVASDPRTSPLFARRPSAEDTARYGAASALPLRLAGARGAYAVGDAVFLAEAGLGVLEIRDSRRRLARQDFAETERLDVALDGCGGAWLRTDDGAVVRIAGGGFERFPHGRVAAVLRQFDAGGEPLAAPPLFAMISEFGVALVTPSIDADRSTPTFTPRVEIPASSGIVDVRGGVRNDAGAIWLVVHVERIPGAEPPFVGEGVAFRASDGDSFVLHPSPLAPDRRGHGISRFAIGGEGGDTLFVAGAEGIALLRGRDGVVETINRGATDVTSRGQEFIFVADGATLIARGGASLEIRPASLDLEGLASADAVAGIRGIAHGAGRIFLSGPRGASWARIDAATDAWPVTALSEVEGDESRRADAPRGRDIEVGAQGGLLLLDGPDVLSLYDSGSGSGGAPAGSSGRYDDPASLCISSTAAVSSTRMAWSQSAASASRIAR